MPFKVLFSSIYVMAKCFLRHNKTEKLYVIFASLDELSHTAYCLAFFALPILIKGLKCDLLYHMWSKLFRQKSSLLLLLPLLAAASTVCF